MAFLKRIEFGNYTLKFGSKDVLLDHFDNIVFPSFLEMKYIRKLKDKGDYFFLDTKLIILNDDIKDPIVGISGRIVKNTMLHRDQVFSNGDLVDDEKSLETAPSSSFLLILNNHRLLFCREMTGAPTLQNFQSTSDCFLKWSYLDYINKVHDDSKEAMKKDSDNKITTKKSLQTLIPKPFLRITPLADKQDLDEFIGRFNQIDTLSIKLLPTNREEIDNDDFWSELGRKRDEMNSNSTRVDFSNPKEGLDSESVLSQARSATSLGNSEVKLKGTDEQGDTIRGNNEDFSLTVDLEDLPKDAIAAAKLKYIQFKNLVSSGVISLPIVAAEVTTKVLAIYDRLKNEI
jgi:hypothetical protein